MSEVMGSNDFRTVAIAKAIATVAHSQQVDKSGKPYIDHPRRVAELVARHGADVVATAWLHDVLEDTELTKDDLLAAGVEPKVVRLVELLTRTEQSPEDYYEALRIGPQGAWHVKIADIADNTNSARLALLDDATIVRLTRKYAKARLLLGASDD